MSAPQREKWGGPVSGRVPGPLRAVVALAAVPTDRLPANLPGIDPAPHKPDPNKLIDCA